VEDRRLRFCPRSATLRGVYLERTIELAAVRLRLRDWPGLGGPLVHVADPLSADNSLVEALAAELAPRYRVLSLTPRDASPYQVDAADLLATLDQFGFETPVLVAEGLGCVAALLVAAWHMGRVAGLVLIDPTCDPPIADGIPARAVKDCPPDWASLRKAVECPCLEVPRTSSAVEQVEHFLHQLAPGVI
jgi:pimeloyl-ACP methyl ester carboxylesterase